MGNRKNLNMMLGANLKREREKAGFTQDRFSELLGIGSKSLSSIERGVVGVSLATLMRICELLQISANVLLYEQSRKNDVESLALQLGQLNDEQFEIASDILNSLMKAFSMKE